MHFDRQRHIENMSICPAETSLNPCFFPFKPLPPPLCYPCPRRTQQMLLPTESYFALSWMMQNNETRVEQEKAKLSLDIFPSMSHLYRKDNFPILQPSHFLLRFVAQRCVTRVTEQCRIQAFWFCSHFALLDTGRTLAFVLDFAWPSHAELT